MKGARFLHSASVASRNAALPANGGPVTDTVILLGEVAERTTWLEVVCEKCHRRGVLSTARLVREYGARMPMAELRRVLAGDCERLKAGKFQDPCGCRFPKLPRPFGAMAA
jgi:hypothetical protein